MGLIQFSVSTPHSLLAKVFTGIVARKIVPVNGEKGKSGAAQARCSQGYHYERQIVPLGALSNAVCLPYSRVTISLESIAVPHALHLTVPDAVAAQAILLHFGHGSGMGFPAFSLKNCLGFFSICAFSCLKASLLIQFTPCIKFSARSFLLGT